MRLCSCGKGGAHGVEERERGAGGRAVHTWLVAVSRWVELAHMARSAPHPRPVMLEVVG